MSHHKRVHLAFGLISLLVLPTQFAFDFQVAKAQDPPVKQRVEPVETATKQITIQSDDDQVTVKIGDELFTRLLIRKYDKPILYPINGPGQIGMTRNWPMQPDVEGDAHDHPHHKSMWFSHEINGVDFWAEKGGITKVLAIDTKSGGKNSFRTSSFWVRKDNGKTMLTDLTTYRFDFDEKSRWIDLEVALSASHGDVTFDDTKEGTFAIRTHPDLRLSANPKQGVEEVFGSALNSNGETGKGIWGKAAKWVLYSGPIDGVPMSVAIFDHTGNVRHPTTWHAREYGLVAANPFGLHHFQGEEKGAGAFTITNGEKLVLRYRAVFAAGILTAKEVEAKWQSFVETGDKE